MIPITKADFYEVWVHMLMILVEQIDVFFCLNLKSFAVFCDVCVV